MRNVSLEELITRVAQKANVEKAQFLKNSEIIGLINESLAKLHDVLVQKYSGEYFLKDHSFTSLQGVDKYDLPTDFYKLQGVDLVIAPSRVIPLKKFNFFDRFKQESFTYYSINNYSTNVRYRIEANSIRFNRIPDAGTNFRIWYVPPCSKLVNPTDVFDGINGYEEYAVIDAAIKIRVKEESDIKDLLTLQQLELKRIEEAAENRDSGLPEVMTDVRSREEDYY